MIILSNGKQGGKDMDKGNDLLEYLQDHHTEEINAVSARELSTLFNITQRGLSFGNRTQKRGLSSL